MLKKWNGDQILKKVRDASFRGIDKTMAECVIHAKDNHPGWQNQTGTAEGSIQIADFARREGKYIVGRWGSKQVNYFIWLELKHGAALRRAADAVYPRLNEHIRAAYAR
jgi:hypothetical protein